MIYKGILDRRGPECRIFFIPATSLSARQLFTRVPSYFSFPFLFCTRVAERERERNGGIIGKTLVGEDERLAGRSGDISRLNLNFEFKVCSVAFEIIYLPSICEEK